MTTTCVLASAANRPPKWSTSVSRSPLTPALRENTERTTRLDVAHPVLQFGDEKLQPFFAIA